MTNNYWKEIKNDFLREDFEADIDGDVELSYSIDAWKTDSDDEEGRSIAEVILTSRGDICVVYKDNVARIDVAAQTSIQEAIKHLRQHKRSGMFG